MEDHPSDKEKIDFALMDRLVEMHPDLDDKSLLKLYQNHCQDKPLTIELLSEQMTDQSKMILASALPDHIDPTNTNSQAQYKIERRIDQGGQSHVYLAHRDDGTYQKTVVIKVLNQSIEGQAQKKQMMAEMQILADLKHPNIVSILDAGIDEHQRPWLMLEYIKGTHIDDYIKTKQLSLKSIIDLLCTVAGALKHIHQQHIAHLDIKPANILVEEIDGKPQPIVIDFGIAMTQSLGAEQSPYVFATPAFAAPEQLDSGNRQPDHRSDIYSLGKLIKYLLTVSNKVDQEAIAKDKALQAILAHCLEEKPKARYQQTQQLLNDLVQYNRGEAVSVHHWTVWQKLLNGLKKHPAKGLLAVTVLGVMFLILVMYNLQDNSNKSTLEQAKEGQSYWQAAEQIHNQTRLIYALPKRQIEEDFKGLNRQYDQLKAQFATEPEPIKSLAFAALGKAAISLGRFEDAQHYLESAHHETPNDVQIKNLLARNLLVLYQAESEYLQNDSEIEQRKIHHNRLKNKYFVPAIALLDSDKSENNHDLLTSSLLLHFQKQSQAAIEQLRNVDEIDLWPIDRLLLLARISKDLANQSINTEDVLSAVQELEQAQSYLQQAQNIARSHPQVYRLLCQTESQLYQLKESNSKDVLSACDDLLVLLPNTAEAKIVAANAYAQLAKSRILQGQSPASLISKIKQILQHQWIDESDELIAAAELIKGHVLTTEGLWQVYSNQAYEQYFQKAVEHHGYAVAKTPNSYTAQFELALAWHNLANHSETDSHQSDQYFEQAISILLELQNHADATALTASKLIRVYTDFAYQSYQKGVAADNPLSAAEHLIEQKLLESPDSHYAQLAMAILYWTYTDYLVFQDKEPTPYLSATIKAFDWVIKNKPEQWIYRFNQVSAMLSGVTYYLTHDQPQTQELLEIEERLSQLSSLVSADISLDSLYGYFHNMQAMNDLLLGINPLGKINLARQFNTSCSDSPIDARTCCAQLASTYLIESMWKDRQSKHNLSFGVEQIKALESKLEAYSKHHQLMAQVGRLYFYLSNAFELSGEDKRLYIKKADHWLSQAVEGNPLLNEHYQSELTNIKTHVQ